MIAVIRTGSWVLIGENAMSYRRAEKFFVFETHIEEYSEVHHNEAKNKSIIYDAGSSHKTASRAGVSTT